MREYLYGAGVRPINNIVDITNFVMLETGQPDARLRPVQGARIRPSSCAARREGEQLTTLDGKEHMLDERHAGHCRRARTPPAWPASWAARNPKSSKAPASVLFECAAFDRANNRITARTLGMRTEASGRFEKGVCARTAMEALERACMLVNMLECGEVVPEAFDHYPDPDRAAASIEAEVERICRRIGVSRARRARWKTCSSG